MSKSKTEIAVRWICLINEEIRVVLNSYSNIILDRHRRQSIGRNGECGLSAVADGTYHGSAHAALGSDCGRTD